MLGLLQFIKGIDIEIEFTDKFRFKGNHFKLYANIGSQLNVIKQQVNAYAFPLLW